MKLSKHLLATIAAVAVASNVTYAQQAQENNGGLFVEPSLSYERGESSVKYPGLSDSSGTADGVGVGARLGFHISEVFFAGVDARYSMIQFKDSSVNYDSTSNAYNFGPVVGMQMPTLGLRLWGAYVVDGQLDPSESQGFDVKFDDPTGPRVGAAFRFASVSIDVEYQQLAYANSTLESAGIFNPGSTFDDVNLENNSWIVSLSFPLEM